MVAIIPQTDQNINVVLTGNINSDLIEIKTKSDSTLILEQTSQIQVTIFVDEKTETGYYKILLSTHLLDASILSYATIKVI